MAITPKGVARGKAVASTGDKVSKHLDLNTPDLFGDVPQNELAVDFGEIHAGAFRAIIEGVCKLGGYIAFSAPSGGVAVKLSVSVGGATGQRWNHNAQELSANVLHVQKLIEKLRSSE